jgi:hypothetical protein
MIQLHRDYLYFETSQGQIVPCSAELVAVELIGEAIHRLDPEVVQQAATAVLHYFSQDLGYQTVSVSEFAEALESALRTLGVTVRSASAEIEDEVVTSDLRELASEAGRAIELSFFPKLRDELRTRLGGSPRKLRFCGLRGCVKQLIGTRRWTQRCQTLHDQIVEFMRDCLHNEAPANSCDLVIC